MWVQIWDAPLDMVSPSVAEEVGSRLGKVEEVEKKNQDDQNMFINEGEVKCQYGDWLRALGGCPRSPPKWTTASPPRSANRGDGAEEVGSEERGGQQRRGTSLAATGVNIENTWKNGSSGGSEILGITLDTQQNLSIILDEKMLHKESAISNPASNVTSFSNSNINFDHVPTFTDHVQSSYGLPTTTAKPRWCRMVRMDYGPTNKEASSSLAQLRKRRAPYADLNEEFHEKPSK